MKDIVKILYESGMLDRIKKSGDALVGNNNPKSISEHSYRAMLIGYILAKLENADENKILKILLFHDLPETRIGDINKIGASYLNYKDAEKKVIKDQSLLFPENSQKEILDLFEESSKKQSEEAIIAKDADYLETAISAKEETEKGIDMGDWINSVEKALKTKSAQEILKEIKKTPSSEWWENLKYIEEINRGKKK